MKRQSDDNPSSFQSSSTINRDISNACLTREQFTKFIRLIYNPKLLNILLSLLATIFNLSDSSSVEITSEFKHFWPLSLSSSSNIKVYSIIDSLNIVFKQSTHFDPFNASTLRSVADLRMVQFQYSDSIKFYIQNLLTETNYFFQLAHKRTFGNEKIFKALIKSCMLLNKNTHAALLCQYLPVIDYNTAFKCLQEKTSLDDMDDLFEDVWDITLLEFIVYINSQRMYNSKRDIGIKLCSTANINVSNPNDVTQRTIEMKRNSFFIKLIQNYFMLDKPSI